MSDQYARLGDLVGRLVASGPKAAHVSASECHEIADGVHELIAEAGALRALLDDAVNLLACETMTPMERHGWVESIRNKMNGKEG